MARGVQLSPLRRLQTGWAAATTATHVAPVILFVLAYHEGGPGLLAVCSVSVAVFGALAALVVGTLADRLKLATVLRQVVTLGSAALVLSAVSAVAQWPAIITILLGTIGVALLSTYRPLQASLLPWLVHTPRELARANVGAAGIESVASLAGPALAGAALLVTSPATAMTVAAACALVTPWPPLGLSVMQPPPSRRDTISPIQSYAAGLVALWRSTPGGGVALLGAVQTFARGALQVLLVLLVIRTFHLGNDAVGWLWAMMGVGGLAGALIGSQTLRVSRLGRGFVVGVLLWGAGLVILASGHLSPVVAGLGMLVVGVGNAVEDASAFTLVARQAPRETVARALSAIEIVAFTSMAVGSLVAPGLVRSLGDQRATLVIGVVVLAFALAYVLTLRRLDHQSTGTEGHTDLLAAVDIFDALPVVVIEHLAGRLERSDFEPGAVVMREGDQGDSFHVIASGCADVSVQGSPRPALGPGDGFGEIALLRGSPRTATITAAEPLTTYSLQRDDFLTALQGRSASAEALADLRLARDAEP